MNWQDFIRAVQKRLAGAIGPSTLRNQGAPGATKAARDFLAPLHLSELKELDTQAYSETLDCWTNQLIEELPPGAQRWGTARKALNVFMLEVFFNRFTAREYNMDRLKDVLETPLDCKAMKSLRAFAHQQGLEVPRAVAMRNLDPEKSEQYQKIASQMASDKGLNRSTLDLELWERGRE